VSYDNACSKAGLFVAGSSNVLNVIIVSYNSWTWRSRFFCWYYGL